jgi:hypothetical protein
MSCRGSIARIKSIGESGSPCVVQSYVWTISL